MAMDKRQREAPGSMRARTAALLAEKLPERREHVQREIDATDRQIDALVYQLYGLTEAEIKAAPPVSAPKITPRHSDLNAPRGERWIYEPIASSNPRLVQAPTSVRAANSLPVALSVSLLPGGAP